MWWVKRVGAGLLWLIVLLCLAIAIVPDFLDARYYRGPVSGHFDGEHFFNPDGADDALSPPGGIGTMLRYVTARDNRPVWPDRVLVTPGRPPTRVDGDRMLATWVGHATVLVQTQGLNILTDPVWSKSAGPFGIGPTRVAEPGIRFEDLPKIDLILVSHDHYDHMDLATLKKLWDRDRPLIVTSLGNDSVIGQAGVPAHALDWGGEIAVRPGVSVVVNRGHHWDSRWFADRNRALWSSFVVRLPGGNLFFSGDTGAGDLKWADRAASYGPIRLALIPIGAFRFTAGQMAAGSHVGPVDAVEVYRRLGAAQAIAIHWGTFRLSYEGWDTPPRLLAAAEACTGQRGFSAVRIGRTMEVPAFAPPPAHPARTRDNLLRCLDTPAVAALR
ncbi:MAG: MBL fold metallo-hydrolase [Sphingomonadales bacterium]|nr:MBL fold metallo-hydrolase [Sphingomonadales bacterium]